MRAREMSAIQADIEAVLAQRAQHDSGAVCATAADGAAPMNGVTVTAAAAASGDAPGPVGDGPVQQVDEHKPPEEDAEEGEEGAADVEMADATAAEQGELGMRGEAPAEGGPKAAECALVKLAASAMAAAAAVAPEAGGGQLAAASSARGPAQLSTGGDAGMGAGVAYDAAPEVLAALHSRPWLEEAMRTYSRAPACAEWAKEIAQARRRHPLRAGRAVALPGGGVTLAPCAEPPAAPQLLTSLALCMTERAVRQDRRTIGQVVKEIKVCACSCSHWHALSRPGI